MKDIFYHISFQDNLEGIWYPTTPKGSNTSEKTDFSEPDIPRISVAPSIENCFRAIYPNISENFEINKLPYMDFFVYHPLEIIKKKTLNWEELTKRKYVHDAHVTKETWIIEPVKMILISKIRIFNTDKPNNELFYRPFDDEKQKSLYHSPKNIDIRILKQYNSISREQISNILEKW